MVVGAKRDVPFETAVAVIAVTLLSVWTDKRYTKASKMKKKPVIDVYMHMLRHRFDRLACMYCQF